MMPRTSRSGHAVLKLVALTGVLAATIGIIYFVLVEAARTVQCRDQLSRIYQALEVYEMSHGSLPRLAFYPEEPLADLDSICVVLEAYGLESSTWICPSSHKVIANAGISYIWNTRLNGRNTRSLREPQWMMVEINALSADAPRPHLGYCNVLFTDGSIARIRNPAETLADW
jgi:prepilin-type processing-associated H-X9-DG protein